MKNKLISLLTALCMPCAFHGFADKRFGGIA